MRGKAAAHLSGLDLSRGLTKAQHADLHAGRSDGVAHLKPGYAKQWEVLTDVETGEKAKVPIIDPATGKQKMEPVHIAGYDISFSASKDVSEYLIAPPVTSASSASACRRRQGHDRRCRRARPARQSAREDSERGRSANYQDAGLSNRTTDRWRTRLVVYLGAAARPTPESQARGYRGDPHLHVHTFLCSMAQKDGGWRKIDGDQLWKTADFRRDVAEVELSRLLEERGIRIVYSDVDRKGRRVQTIEGFQAREPSLLLDQLRAQVEAPGRVPRQVPPQDER